MAKITRQITIDPLINEKAKLARINVSNVCENAIKARIDAINDQIPEIKELENSIKKLESEMENIKVELTEKTIQLQQAEQMQKDQEEQELKDRLLMSKAIKNTDMIRYG